MDDNLLHYGVKRKSGRYPWGSGEDPNQHGGGFLSEYDNLRAKGLSETQIATSLGMNTTQLRDAKTWANKERREAIKSQIEVMKEQGTSNVKIAETLGVSEATVRNYQSAKQKTEKIQIDNVTDAVRKGVEQTGYLDVGVGVERQLGVSRTKFNTVVNKLVEDGELYVHEVHVKRLSDPSGSKYTTVKVLTKNPDPKDVNTNENKAKIRHLDSYSDDGGQTISRIGPPKMVNLDRIKVRYAEEGGADKDGLIELRRGVNDLDLGASNYAQVRIGAGKDRYLKGMAAYSDDAFPKGVDIIFNTNKSSTVSKENVLKKMSDNPDNPFGATITKQRGALNIVNQQGDWDVWSKTMSSQFLSKQTTSLIKDRLDSTYKALHKEFDEINSLTNPVVKAHLMEKYIEGLDSKAKNLKAQGLKGTKSHVLLPITDINPKEIYATNYPHGSTVVLVRHPHGGIFEIPELRVNNRNATAKRMLGDGLDAVGIHPTVAQKLSGADFDGDTALVIPNNRGQIKTSRELKELKNFDPMSYKVDYQTIAPRTKQIEMGKVSNLITDMTIKGASQSELARAVKHSMVVIDAEKHNLDYKKSARDNGIQALRNKYQTHINPETGKPSTGASTLISVSKRKVDISQHETARELSRDKIGANGKVLKKGLTASEIAQKMKISEKTVSGYLKGETFDPDKYSSGTMQETLYSNYIKGVQSIKNTAIKAQATIKTPAKSAEAAKIYESEVKSLNAKLNTALLNAPRERQAQIMTNNLYYKNLKPDMTSDDKKKLKSQSLAKAREAVGAKKESIKITAMEWEAIQARAVSPTKLKDILNNADMDIVRKLATPKQSVMSTAKEARAKLLLDKGYTYAEVANVIGVSPSSIRDALGITKTKDGGTDSDS